MLGEVPNLCQAYLLRAPANGSEADGARVSLTFWETPEAMTAGGVAIGAWQAAEASAGRAPAYVATGTVGLFDLHIGRAGWETLHQTLEVYERAHFAMHTDQACMNRWRRICAHLHGIPWTDLWSRPPGAD